MTWDLNNFLDGQNPTLLHGVLAVMTLVGLAIWLLGRSVARPLCAASGLVAGAAAMLFVSERLKATDLSLLLLIGGGLVGCVLTWFLFRLWMGVALSATLALAIPVAACTWLADPPTLSEETDETVKVDVQPDADRTVWWDRLQAIANDAVRRARHTWDGLTPAIQGTMVVSAGAGATVGLVFGLLAPYWGASLVTALCGTILVLTSLLHWIDMTGWQPPPSLMMPSSKVVATGLITVVGAMLQWIFFRPRSD